MTNDKPEIEYSMVERVASRMVGQPLHKLHPDDLAAWLGSARLAIEAMREPTEAMIEASYFNRPYADGGGLERLSFAGEYKQAIDAALEEHSVA